jgi:hypothetical protein
MKNEEYKTDVWDYPFDREYNQYSFHIDWGHSFLAVID